MSATTRDIRARIEQRRHPFEARHDCPSDQERRARYMARHRSGMPATIRLDACTTREEPMPGVHDLNEEQDR